MSHPAVDVAVNLLAAFGGGARAVAVIDRDPSIVPVLVQTGNHRLILFAEFDGSAWAVAGPLATAVAHSDHTRASETVPYSPIDRMYSRWHATPAGGGGRPWYAVSGYVAADAVAVTLSSGVDTHRVEPDPDGLVFAAVRADTAQDNPALLVHLGDGRIVAHPEPQPA